MIIPKHHYTNRDGNLVSVYWYEDRYRYTVSTCMGIEYRELGPDPEGLLQTIPNTDVLETYMDWDTFHHVYHEHQLKAKCIRCSKHHGAPRKEYNLASLCNRCYAAMNDTSVSEAHVWYTINEDGSKGSVIKQD
jgi:ribosomal protein S14